jgi:hypothetical protein
MKVQLEHPSSNQVDSSYLLPLTANATGVATAALTFIPRYKLPKDREILMLE